MNESTNSERESVRKFERWDIILSFFLIAVAIETLPLRSSLWLDETLTYWIASGSIEDVWRRSLSFQGQSPLYYVIAWSVLKLFPESDLALRMVSICCASLGLYCLYKFIARSAALPFALSFIISIALLSDTFQVLFLSARPYGVAFLCAIASIHVLVSWITNRNPWLLVSYVLTTLLTFYSHYLFILVVLLHIVIAVSMRAVRSYIAALPFILVGAIPGVFQLLSLRERAQLLSFAQRPTFLSIAQSFFSPALLIVFVVALLLAVIWGGRINRQKLDRKLLCVALVWLILPVLAFAGVSSLGSTSLFTARYWSWQIGGAALLFSMIVGALTPIRAQRIAVMLLILGMLFRLSVQTWRIEGWREAAVSIKKESELPVLLYSGLIEAEDPSFPDRVESQRYLSAPLKRYGVANPIRSVGLKDVGELQSILPTKDFLFVTTLGKRGDLLAPTSFLQSFEGLGRKIEQISVEGTVSVYKVLGETRH